MMSSSLAGGDLLFDEKLCEQGRNFCNKIWNALRLVTSGGKLCLKLVLGSAPKQTCLSLDATKINEVQLQTEINFEGYRLSENLILIYMIWDDFCAYYLEMIKPEYGSPIDVETLKEANTLLSDLMIILHPFMPFILKRYIKM